MCFLPKFEWKKQESSCNVIDLLVIASIHELSKLKL